MMKKCFLMGCEVPEDEPTLIELTNEYKYNKAVADQARLLIENFGIPETVYLCEDCFWK